MNRIPTPPPLPPQISHNQFFNNWLCVNGLIGFKSNFRQNNINTILDLVILDERKFRKMNIKRYIFSYTRRQLENDGVIYNDDRTITTKKDSLMEYWFNQPL